LRTDAFAGSQYTSLLFCDRAYDEQVRLSFGRIGTAADNAAIEAFCEPATAATRASTLIGSS